MNALVHLLLRAPDRLEKSGICISSHIPTLNNVVEHFPDYLLIMGAAKCLWSLETMKIRQRLESKKLTTNLQSIPVRVNYREQTPTFHRWNTGLQSFHEANIQPLPWSEDIRPFYTRFHFDHNRSDPTRVSLKRSKRLVNRWHPKFTILKLTHPGRRCWVIGPYGGIHLPNLELVKRLYSNVGVLKISKVFTLWNQIYWDC